MDLPEFDTLEVARDGFMATVWFNTPEARNALTAQRVGELRALCAWLRKSGDIRGVVFRGRGGVFCAGGDLKAFKQVFQGQAGSRDEVVALSLETGDFLRDIYTLPQFTVMVIEGAAVAGGFGLACVGDCVIAQKDAVFSLSETRIGLTPAQIAPYVIDRMGLRDGRRLMLTGAQFDGAEALRLGVVDELAKDIEPAIDRQRTLIAGAAPGALAAIKAQIVQMPFQTHAERTQSAAEIFADRMLSDEAREGISAFVEKRKPNWATPQS